MDVIKRENIVKEKKKPFLREDGGWVIYPGYVIPITLFCSDEKIVNEIIDILENLNLNFYQKHLLIMKYILRYNIKCKEIEDYINNYRPIYLQEIEKQILSSEEWKIVPERDKEDLLKEFKKKAINSLYVRPYCDLEKLFDCEPSDLSLDDKLIERYEFENLRVYLRYYSDLGKIRIIPSNHRDRRAFEKLWEKGLAKRGLEIPLGIILETLKLNELNEAVKDIALKSFNRKKEAIEFITSLPDAIDRIGKIIAFREVFQLNPLPQEYNNINIKEISKSWQYANEYAFLILHTFVMSETSAKNDTIDELKETGFKELLILTANDDKTCPYCKDLSQKIYKIKDIPKVPLHIGCRCTIIPKEVF